MMIPKIIHYCWFGRTTMPDELQKYVDEWRLFYPDFQFMRWDEDNFDVSQYAFTKEAYSLKKYAFVSDFVRLWAVYKYGGLYMDTDIKVLKSVTSMFDNRFFTAIEYHEDNVRLLNIGSLITSDGKKKNKDDIIRDICVESSIFATEKGHPFIKDCLSYYEDRHFILEDGSLNDKIIIPMVMGLMAEKYGFRYVNEEQHLEEGILLLPDEYFTHPTKQTSNTMALHMVKNSWKEYTFFQRVYSKLASKKEAQVVYRMLEKNALIKRLLDLIQKMTWLN